MKPPRNSGVLKWLLMIFLLSKGVHLSAQNKELIDSLQNLIGKKNSDTNEVRALNKMCLLVYRSYPDSALQYAQNATILAKKIKYERGLSACNMMLGICHSRLGKKKEAIAYFEAAQKIAEDHKIMMNRIYALAEIGLAHFELGNYIKAEEEFLKALKLAKESNDIPWQYSLLNNMGMVNFTQKNYDVAAGYYKQVIDYMRTADDRKNLASGLNNMGNVLFTEQKYNEALVYYKEAIAIGEELNDKLGLAARYNNTGIILVNQKKYKEALSILEKSLAISKETGNLFNTATALQNLAVCNRETGNFDLAITQCEEALELARKIGAKDTEKDALHNLSLLHQAKGDAGKSLEYYKAHIAVKDSLIGEAVSEKIAELQIAYETSEKNEEISKLKTKEAQADATSEKQKKWLIIAVFGVVTLLLLVFMLILRNRNKAKQREAEFQKKKIELEQKAMRAQMNPHFIFNSLNSIQRLFMEGKMEIANEYMADFSDLMRKILDNSSKAKINIREEINTLELYLNLEKLRNKEIFDYSILIADDIDEMNTLVPPLVLQPFVENAIWHGILPGKQKGKVNIAITKNEKELICVIEDNGIGIAESKRKMEGSTGKIPKHESKGMQLTEQRLGTKIKTENLDPGTRITLFIPLD